MHATQAADALDTCLDPTAMRPLLQNVLPGSAGRHWVIDDVRVLSARRNASRRRNPNPLTLRYEADVHDDATGAAHKLQWYGKVYRGGASAQVRRDAPALHLPQLDMLLWPWPVDPGLPQLAQLLDPAQTRQWWGEPAHTVSALRYEPEQRATLRYTRPGRDAQARHLYVKTFSDAGGAALQHRFAYFWDRAAQAHGSPVVARPLGYCPDTRAFWQAQARGMPLAQALKSANAARLPALLAQAIAAVHAAPHALAGPLPHDVAHWLSEMARRRKKIVRAAPHLAARMARLAEAIEQTAVLMPQAPLTLIHGDFHAGQAWLDGARVVLFDFDEFTLGDPMEDLAAFVTRLDSLTGDASFAAQFLAAYRAIAPQCYCPLRLQWHRVVQQVLQTSRAFVFQVPGWPLAMQRRLALAETLCASAPLEVHP